MPAKKKPTDRHTGKDLSEMSEQGGTAPLPGDLQRIAELAGLEAALKIAKEFRGTHIYIPDIFKKIRDDEIREGYDEGMSARSLALKHGIAERTVWDILKKPF